MGSDDRKVDNMSFNELFNTFADIAPGDITPNENEQLKEKLSSFTLSDLISDNVADTVRNHRMFIELVQKMRLSIEASNANIGKHYYEMIKSAFSAGSEGSIYSSEDRIIFELIQNVDDCEYDDENANLHISFVSDEENSRGRIVFEYNENGFTPANVVAITGIADEYKNISNDKIEIGEKGIGFKTVFGIADRVIIESGYFSFEIKEDNFCVPIPHLDENNADFGAYVKGTRMTLEILDTKDSKGETVKSSLDKTGELYQKLFETYQEKTALINNNPILFLNNLDSLEISCGTDTLVIKTEKAKGYSRTQIRNIDEEIIYEKHIAISLRITDSEGNVTGETLECDRYTMPIVYDESACKSRYGDNTILNSRRHNIIMLMPYFTDGQNDVDANAKDSEPLNSMDSDAGSSDDNFEWNNSSNGILYSFFPTKTTINAPVILHAPFKLTDSRESVNTQNQNEWFRVTTEGIIKLVYAAYENAARNMKETAADYIPQAQKYIQNPRGWIDQTFFAKENRRCYWDLWVDECDALKGETIRKTANVYYINDDCIKTAEEVVALPDDWKITEKVQREIRELINFKELTGKELFIPARGPEVSFYDVDSVYGIDRIDDNEYGFNEERFLALLLSEGFSSDGKFEKSIEIIREFHSTELRLDRAVCELLEREIRITVNQISFMARLNNLCDGFDLAGILSRICNKIINGTHSGTLPVFMQAKDLSDDVLPGNIQFLKDKSDDFQKLIIEEALNDKFRSYYEDISEEKLLIYLDGKLGDEGICLPCANAIVVVAENEDSARDYLIDFLNKNRNTQKCRSYKFYLMNQKLDKDLQALLSDRNNYSEFMSELAEIREEEKKTIDDCSGMNYERIIANFIDNSSTNNRFISELFQNADDCEYDVNKPQLKLSFNYEKSRLEIAYNENGFTAEDVGAITSLGNTTKKEIVTHGVVSKSTIGGKGVGFKSVFAVADKVRIRSRYFDFSLFSKAPTVPVLPEGDVSETKGTRMIFTVGEDSRDGVQKAVSVDMVLPLCVCLRKIKKITTDTHVIEIEDKDGIRIITVTENGNDSKNKKEYYFEITEHFFSISDEMTACECKITCYIPMGNYRDVIENRLYVGLPTNRRITVPLIIDAPFKLTTSREDVVSDNKWNEAVCKEIRDIIIHIVENRREEQDSIRFIPEFHWDKCCLFDIGSSYLNNLLNNEFNITEALSDTAFLPRLYEDRDGEEDRFVKPDDAIIISEFLQHGLIIKNKKTKLIELLESGQDRIINTRELSEKSGLDEKEAVGKIKKLAGESVIFDPRKELAIVFELIKGTIPSSDMSEKDYDESDTVSASEIDCVDDNRTSCVDVYKKIYKTLNGVMGQYSKQVSADDFYNAVRKFAIYPIRTETGDTAFIPCDDKMCWSRIDVLSSNDEHLILDTSVLSREDFKKYTGYSLEEYTRDDVLKEKVDRLVSEVVANDNDSDEVLKNKAEKLLQEYENNRDNRDYILFLLHFLKDRIDEIPAQFANGEFYSGDIFVKGANCEYNGSLLKCMYVHKDYDELFSKIDGVKKIEDISRGDLENIFGKDLGGIKNVVGCIGDDDLRDINFNFRYRKEVLEALLEKGNLTEAQKQDVKVWLDLEKGCILPTLKKDEFVRSKSEVIIAICLWYSGIDYEYEQSVTRSGVTILLPDFTIEVPTDDDKIIKIYWEHLGMMKNQAYREWQQKKITDYRQNELLTEGVLITTREEGVIDAGKIDEIVKRIKEVTDGKGSFEEKLTILKELQELDD